MADLALADQGGAVGIHSPGLLRDQDIKSLAIPGIES